MQLSIIGYDPAGAWHRFASTVEELLANKNPAGITWIDVEGLESSDVIHRFAEEYRIHPLTVEDILDTGQRPKVEEFDDYLFIVVKAVNPADELDFEQISLVITENAVITFQEKTGDFFDGIRKRILNNAGRIRRAGTGYLAYSIIDAVVDEYFVILDRMGDTIESFEDRAIDESDDSFIRDIQTVKQNLLRIRRIIWPLRESVNILLRLESKLINKDLEPFFKDLYDNIMQAVETVESYRELIAGEMEVNLSAVSNRMNKVMKVLTIISTIFIPLTFIVGVYGMNFAFMPELGMRYAYPVTWGIMICIAIGMIIFFKTRKWL
ncbi:MAG: magnesium/cobalt transporter CorA [Treponema sp.]|jgi:magnesium transporter|nr:magnesium/cobalt transporter CorA [Treponema sp.]